MYIISPITVHDEDKDLFETHIGLDNEERTLLLSVYGKSEDESRMCANGTIQRLNLSIGYAQRSPSINHYPLTIEECTPIIGEGPESEDELK